MSRKLATRELAVIVAGGLILLGAGGFRLVKAWSARSATVESGSIQQSVEKIETHERLRGEVDRMRGELEITIADGSVGEQESNIRDDLNRKASARGLQFKSLKRIIEGGRGQVAASKPIKFRLDLEGPFIGLLGFMYDLEKSKTPYVMLSVNTQGSSRAAFNDLAQPGMDSAQAAAAQLAARAGSDNSNGIVRVNLTIQSYLWPEGERPPTLTPSPSPSPTVTMTPAISPTPAPSESPSPSPSPSPHQTGGPPPMPGGAASATRSEDKWMASNEADAPPQPSPHEAAKGPRP